MDNKIRGAIEAAVNRSYGFSSKVQTALDAAIKKAQLDIDARVERIVREEVKAMLGDQMIQRLIDRVFAGGKPA